MRPNGDRERWRRPVAMEGARLGFHGPGWTGATHDSIAPAGGRRYDRGMTIRTHLLDLKEQRDTYARLLDSLESGKLVSVDPRGNDARMEDLRLKLSELDALIKKEEARRP